MKDDELLHKWVNGTISAEELEIFKLRPEYESLVELYKNTDGWSAPIFDEDAVLTKILQKEKKTSPPASKGRRIFLSSWVKYGVAASLLLLAAWFFFPKPNNFIQIELAKGEREEGALPDQSTFVLNAESTLSYDLEKWKNERTLDLKGEAFFRVKKGSKFLVQTPNGNVQVLGTQFNVWSRNNILEVKCQSGKVAVLSPGGTLLEELNPNDAVRISSGKITEKWQVVSTEKTNWVDGIFRFKKVPLEIVLEELERQFQIQIKANNVNTAEVLTCNFQIEDLELALKTSLAPLGIQYEIKNDKTVILNK